jgi:uncharacterized protein (DUF885 family)
MSPGIRIVVAGIAAAALAACAPASTSENGFEQLSREYLEWYFAVNPVRATFLGVHDHDARLPDLSHEGIARRTEELERWLAWLQAIDRETLHGDAVFDHEILDHAMRADLLELEEVRGWQRNPMRYNRVIATGISSLIDREFAPLEERLRSLMARLASIPDVTEAARANLSDVPRLWAELAARNTRGTLRFLAEDVPEAIEAQGGADLDPALSDAWSRAHAEALQRVGAFAAWLEEDLLPRAEDDFRLGAELFERKLFYEQHVSLSVEELRRMNDEAIAAYREWVAREAARLEPPASPVEAMERVTADSPGPEELLPVARRYVDQAREFIVEREIVTLPADAMPIIRPTPAFARSGFASMSTPGPFERRATEAYYNITNVDPEWTAEQQRQHLTYFNHAGLLGISVHEAMPGHFVQLLYRRQIATDVRKVFSASSLVEGWAHYTEQMMIDEGLGDGDPVVRLGQLRRALQRHARWNAGLSMHAFGTSVEEAAARFEEIAYFAPFPALRETQRGTYDPTYLVYALGRMEIFRLREDYRAYVEARGETFSLRDFHDRFLQLGLPIPLARRAMIPEG